MRTLSTNSTNYPDAGVPWLSAQALDTASSAELARAIGVITAGADTTSFYEQSLSPFGAGASTFSRFNFKTILEVRAGQLAPASSVRATLTRADVSGQLELFIDGADIGNYGFLVASALTSMSVDFLKGVGDYGLMALEVDGDVRLYTKPPNNSAPTLAYAQPLNLPGCVASRPEIVVVGVRPVVAWQERCNGGTGPWRIAARLIK